MDLFRNKTTMVLLMGALLLLFTAPLSGLAAGMPHKDFAGDTEADNMNWRSLSSLSPTATTLDSSISGRVTDPQGQALADISVSAVDSRCDGNWFASVTGETGDYTVSVPAGEYYVMASASPSYQNYTLEWWNDGEGTPDCRLATAVTAPAEQTTPNIDFALAAGGAVSGRVTDAQGDPISNIHVSAEKQACGGTWLGGIQTDANGDYRITGLPGGDCFITARASRSGLAYLMEEYKDINTVTNCDLATAVPVTVGQNTGGIDFSLDRGGVISGRITDPDGNPLNNITVNAVDNKCDGNWYHERTDEDGEYMIVVPTGTYYVIAVGSHVYQNYALEWWNDGEGTPDCNEAAPVDAVVGQTTGSIDFILAAGGSLSGKATDADGNPIQNLQVDVRSQGCGGNWLGGMDTDLNGQYCIAGLPEGNVYVKTCSACSGLHYRDEWYDNALICSQAAPVRITVGQNTQDIDFSLIDVEGTTLTGAVASDSDGQPVQGVQICAWPFPGGSGNCTTTQSDGSYTLTGVTPGYLKVEASGGGYLTEYYEDSYDPNWATAVFAPEGESKSGIDFSMGVSGSISGTVYQSNKITPLANVCVGAYMHPCGDYRYRGAKTDENGNYTLSNLPPQNYYLRTHAACTSPQSYHREWWDSIAGTLVCDHAEGVNVVSGQDTADVDFYLEPSNVTYPGPVFRSAGLFSHNLEGFMGTIFYAFISGPSPEDIISLTAAGPSGTFDLVLAQWTFKQMGNIYIAGSESVVSDGVYAFEITDSLGRTASVERPFTYDSTVPQVNSSTMKVDGMGNQAYIGTTSPTLTWDPVTWPSTPGYYDVHIYDYDGRAIWYYTSTEDSSLTIPRGYLEPDTAYYWYVRTCDTPATGAVSQNRRYSEAQYFYTGSKGDPDLDDPNNKVLSYTTPSNGWANWMGVTRTNLAPWDINRYDVTGPEGTDYWYSGRMYICKHPMFYECWSPGPAPTPEGSYAFLLEDQELTVDTLLKDFIWDPASPIPESNRLPADNAYIYSKTPTFTWSAPAAAGQENPRTYYYQVRIYDYRSKILMYHSPLITETSFTLPEEAVDNAPPGSYKWNVAVFTDLERTNGAFSSKRTITIPPLSDYTYTFPGGTGIATDYRIFTIPLYTGTIKGLLERLEKTLGTYDPRGRWRIFFYMNYGYFEINDPVIQEMPYAPGDAAWIISRDTTQVPFTGGAVSENMFTMKLKGNAWRLVGLPWQDTAIDLNKIRVTDGTRTYFITDEANNLTGHVMWEYTGTGPDSGYVPRGRTDTLTPGTGYFFKVVSENAVTLVIPPDNTAPTLSDLSNRDKRGWKTNLPIEEEPPPPPPGSQPIPDIKANGEDDSVTVPPGSPISLSISLDPGAWAGREADFWVAAYTYMDAPYNWFTYVFPIGWQLGIYRCVKAPLFEIPAPFEVFNMPLPTGHYTFCFAVDGNADDIPNVTWYDIVEVTVLR